MKYVTPRKASEYLEVSISTLRMNLILPKLALNVALFMKNLVVLRSLNALTVGIKLQEMPMAHETL